jgi:hypothetical protein
VWIAIGIAVWVAFMVLGISLARAAGYGDRRMDDENGWRAMSDEDYRLWVNDERTVMVRIWTNGIVEVATREHLSHTWGPPVIVKEER